MMLNPLRFSIALACMLVIACDDAPASKPRPSLPTDDGFSRKGPELAAISTDFTATSISLLSGELEVLADDYLDSGSSETGLVTALSGDVQMPTYSGERGVMVLIDRLKTDVITRVDLANGDVLSQIKTHTPDLQDGETAFSSNPQDYLRVANDAAWVTRSQPNLDPGAAQIDRGNDLIRLDPTTGKRTDDRIDLSALNTTATRTDPDTGTEEEVEIYAHPTRMARAAGKLIVGLSRAAYDFSAYASGMVAVIDLESMQVSGLEIEDLKSCEWVSPIPGATDRVLVGCTGDVASGGETIGLAIVRVSGGKASIARTWKAKDHEDSPALSGSLVALGGDLIGAASNAFVPGGDDSVFGTLDLESGEFSELLAVPAGNTFGTPFYDSASKTLLVPDASLDSDMRPTGGIRVLERKGDEFEERDTIKVAEDTGMPVRHVFPL